MFRLLLQLFHSKIFSHTVTAALLECLRFKSAFTHLLSLSTISQSYLVISRLIEQIFCNKSTQNCFVFCKHRTTISAVPLCSLVDLQYMVLVTKLHMGVISLHTKGYFVKF